MRLDLRQLLAESNQAGPFLSSLTEYLTSVDEAYDSAARHYGFQCTGCRDNCCRTRFYHHTLLEYLYLHAGYVSLAPEIKADVRQRAADVASGMRAADASGATFRRMCPANADGLCLVYTHRPMICRMHGLPNQMLSPRGGFLEGPGCDAFHEGFDGPVSVRMNRTPHYKSISKLERKLRQSLGWEGRLKMTVAEMILTFAPGRESHEPG